MTPCMWNSRSAPRSSRRKRPERTSRSWLVGHHGADRLAALHQVEAFVDLLEGQNMGDEIVDIDLAVHVPVDDARHVGAAAGAPEGRAQPLPPGDELEGPRADFRARWGHANDDGLAPAAMGAFQ